jgi:hypothetical protein
MAPSRRHADLKPWTILSATLANAALVATVFSRKRWGGDACAMNR